VKDTDAEPETGIKNEHVGIALGLTALFLFASQDAMTRYLVQDLPVPQLLTIRFTGFAAFAIAFAIWRLGPRKAFATSRLVLQIARSALLLVEIAIFSLGLRYLGVADMHAVFAVFPLVVTALAGPLLGETVGWRRWIAVGIGFVGTLIILRPGMDIAQSAALLPVIAALMWGLYNILTRMASRTDPPETSLLFTGVVSLVLIAPFGIAHWTPPSADQWPLLLLLVLVSTTSHLFLIMALARIEAAAFQPFNYMLLVFATLIGWLAFNELPDFWTVIGALIVVGSGLYVILRERYLTSRNIVKRPLPRRPG